MMPALNINLVSSSCNDVIFRRLKAEERFRAAIKKIDSGDADYFYHLGLVLKEEAKHQEAHDLFERGVQLNEKASNHEVLRELGYSQMDLGHMEEFIHTLDRYTNLRPYDPVGLAIWPSAAQTRERGGREFSFRKSD